LEEKVERIRLESQDANNYLAEQQKIKNDCHLNF
jgi:hypothetical protein